MQKFIYSMVLLVTLANGLYAGANPDSTLRVAGSSSFAGALFDSEASFDNTGISDVAGWSFGVCHDTSKLRLNSAMTGADTIGLNGSGPAFESIELPVGG